MSDHTIAYLSCEDSNVCQSQFPNSFHPSFPTLVFVWFLCFCFCFANKFISTIFLNSIYTPYYTIFVFFFFLTFFTVWQSLGPYVSSKYTITLCKWNPKKICVVYGKRCCDWLNLSKLVCEVSYWRFLTEWCATVSRPVEVG